MIAIGRITGSVGVKGEVKVAAMTDIPDRFLELRSVFVGTSEQDAVEHSVASVRKHGPGVVMKLERINSRTSSDEVRGKYLLIPDDQARRSSGNSFYWHELEGLRVLTEEGVEIGAVKEIVHLPAGDAWIVKSGEREMMIPGVKEFIRSVDLSAGTVVIHTIEGLLE